MLCAFGCVTVAIHPLFLQGLLPHAYDVDTFYAPSWRLLAESLHSGSIPTWNPYAFGGAPFLGNPQSQALYPPTLILFAALSLPSATLAWFAFHYLLAAGGTFRLACNLTTSPRGAAIAAVTFAASTYLVARVQAPTLVAGAAWMPVVLAAAIGKTFTSSGPKPRFLNVPLAIAFALQILSGSQQVLVLTAVACLLSSLAVRSLRLALRTTASLGIGALIAAPQLLPMAAIVKRSTASAGIDTHGFGALSWDDRAILAGAFSRTAAETAPMYVGMVGLGQGLVGLVADHKRRPVHVMFALGALSIVWSLGWIGRFIAPIVPSLATVTAHQPVRALPLAVLVLALGVGTYWDRPRGRAHLLAAVALSGCGFVVAGTAGPVSLPVVSAALAAMVAVMLAASRRPSALWPVVAFAIVLTGDLAVHNVNLRNTHQPPAVWQPVAGLYPKPPPTVAALQGVGLAGYRFAWLAPPRIREHQLRQALTPTGRGLLLNGGSVRYGLPTVSGYDPVIDRRWVRLMRISNRVSIADRHFVYVVQPATGLLRAYATRDYICLTTECPAVLTRVWSSGDLSVVHDTHALPFARITTQSQPDTHRPLWARWNTPSSFVVVDPNNGAPAGLVSVASRYEPGWRVKIGDGRSARVVPGQFGEMTANVPKGWHRLRFWYEPPGLRIGILLAVFGLLVCIQGIVSRIVRRAMRTSYSRINGWPIQDQRSSPGPSRPWSRS